MEGGHHAIVQAARGRSRGQCAALEGRAQTCLDLGLDLDLGRRVLVVRNAERAVRCGSKRDASAGRLHGHGATAAGRSEDGPAMRRTRSSSCRRPARRSSVTSRSRRESRSRASEAARMAAAKFFRAVRASPVPRAQCHARELGSKILSRCVSASARQSRAQCGAR